MSFSPIFQKFTAAFKCLADIGNVVDVNLVTQISHLRDSCKVKKPCETTVPGVAEKNSAATSLRRNQRKNKSTITLKFAKKTTTHKYLMADHRGNLKFHKYRKENSKELQTPRQTVYFQFKYFDDFSIIPLLSQSRHRTSQGHAKGIIETVCHGCD